MVGDGWEGGGGEGVGGVKVCELLEVLWVGGGVVEEGVGGVGYELIVGGDVSGDLRRDIWCNLW